MSVQDLTNAIVSGINDGAEAFLEGTLAAALPAVWLMLLGLVLGRSYILTMIDRFTLRLGADLLWVIYVILRDLLIVGALVMSFMFFFPDVVGSNALPITGGLAAVAVFGVLMVQLMGDPDHNLRDYRLFMGLLVLGSILYFVPYIFGVQFNSVATGTMKDISDSLVTNTNTTVALWLSYISIALLAILGAVAAAYTLRTGGRPEIEEAAASK